MRQSYPFLELALLGFMRQGPRHGYAIHQELSEPSGLGPVWQIKLSQLYALLGKLEEAGYLSATAELQDGKPPRKVFHLTGTGQDAFLEWVESPVRHGRSLRLEFLVKLFFARREGPDTAAHLLAAQRNMCLDWLAVEQKIIDDERDKGRRYNQLVHQFRLGQVQAMLDWLIQCEEG